MHRRLSDQLKNLGFFPALGTTECRGLPGETLVRRSKPYTYDTNNGVAVVYDEGGEPWVDHQDHCVNDIIATLVKQYNLSRGAYVPHSNDNGSFFIEIGIVKP